MNPGIYCFRNKINNKKYIGQGKDLKKRKRQFRPNRKYSGQHFFNAVKKYGIENFEYSILTHCKAEELNYYEQFYINRLHTNDPRYGYNMTSGGDCGYSLNMTEEHKQAISAAWTEERKKEQSIKQKGKNNPNYGRRWNDKEREKASKLKKSLGKKKLALRCGLTYQQLKKTVSNLLVENPTISYQEISTRLNIGPVYTKRICDEIGYTRDKAEKNRLDKSKIPIVQCDRDNHDIVLNVFESIKDAERITGIKAIHHCVEGAQYSSGGYFWRRANNEVFTGIYNEEFLKPKEDRLKLPNYVKEKLRDKGLYKKEHLYKKCFCYNKEGKLVKIYNSVSDAINDGFTSVVGCCNGRYKTCNGYIFSHTELSKNEIKENYIDSRRKPIIQMTTDGIFIREWGSATEAAKSLNLDISNINSCCHGKSHTCGGFKWKFID